MNNIINTSLIFKKCSLGLLVLLCCFSCKVEPKKQNNQKPSTKLVKEVEQFRSSFHFTPEANWMNDPNGLVYYNGYYHLFYQYYPDSTVWGPMHWGHAKSTDLLHWEHLPIALYPDDLGYIFSGSAVIDKNNTAGFGKNAMVAIFTYHNPEFEKAGRIDYQTQGIAFSTDEGLTWTKYKQNPVIGNPGIQDFRDPKVFWNENISKWQLLLVAKDHVQIYQSTNLKDWNKLSDFRFKDEKELGVWECPDLFKLPVDGTNEEKWVLIISHGGESSPNGGSGTRYFVGDYDGKTFTTDQVDSKWVDYGTDNYAGVTFNNTPNNERLFIGWMSNWDYATVTPTKKWRSAMTLPRQLSLTKDKVSSGYLLNSKVISELDAISTKVPKSEFTGDYPNKFKYKNLQESKIELDVSIKDALTIAFKNDLNEEFVINYNKETGIFSTDRTASGITSFSDNFLKHPKQIMQIGEREKLAITIILDKSSVEIFVNDGEYSMTNQIFPNADYTTFEMNSTSGVRVNKLNIESIKTIL